MANNQIKTSFDSDAPPSKSDIQDLFRGSTEHVLGRGKTGEIESNLDIGTQQFPIGELHARTIVVGGVEIDVNNIGGGGGQIASDRLQKASHKYYCQHENGGANIYTNPPVLTSYVLPAPQASTSYIAIELTQAISLHEIQQINGESFGPAARSLRLKIWGAGNNSYINYMPVRAYVRAQGITITSQGTKYYLQRYRIRRPFWVVWLLGINEIIVSNTTTGEVLAKISTGNNNSNLGDVLKINDEDYFYPAWRGSNPEDDTQIQRGLRDDALLVTSSYVLNIQDIINPKKLIFDGTHPEIYRINLNNFNEIGNPVGSMTDNFNDFGVDADNNYSYKPYSAAANHPPNIFVTEI